MSKKVKVEKFTQYRATSPDGKIQVTAKTEKEALKLLEEKITTDEKNKS